MVDSSAKFLVGGLCGVIIGFGTSVAYSNYSISKGPVVTPCTAQYSLTNQMLDCVKFDAKTDQLGALDAQLNQATQQYVTEGKATRVSVFVRTLRSRQSAASNENDSFAPASLLKLPLMISYFKLAEIEPSILDSQLTYASSSQLNNSTQDIESPGKLVPGQKYTVEALIEDMVVNSDNNSTSVLLSHMDPAIFNNTLIDLGLKIPAATTEVDFVTAKTYASIFSSLYNASYLNRDYSQKALALMSKSAFKGIYTGLPADTIVADKFGERQIENMDGTVAKRELHDCGVVYVKDMVPYTLCIMTEGSSFDDLQSIIKNLSQIVYTGLK